MSSIAPFPSDEDRDQYKRHRKDYSGNRSSNLFTIAVLIGVASFIIATSLPDGGDGSIAFLAGFLISFLLLVSLLVVLTTHIKSTRTPPSVKENTSLQCPVCQSDLTLTLTKAPTQLHKVEKEKDGRPNQPDQGSDQ